MSASSDIYLFADFRLDRAGGGLFRRDDRGAFAPVTIGSRALDLLAVLVERRGDVVSKEEIAATVWPRTAVEEGNLFVHISSLRAILDGKQSGQSCIQTITGRGYRFIAPVTRWAEGRSSTETVEPTHAESVTNREATPIAAHASEGTRPPVDAAPRAAERRHITALAAELAWAAGDSPNDPEELRVVIDAFRRLAAGALSQYGGAIAESRGREIAAYFGHRQAQENDAERAVRAALAIQRALSEANAHNADGRALHLAARVGLDSGLVVVDAMGEVFGEAPNLAARVRALAEPGTVLVTARVQRQAAGLFIAEDRGAHALEGAPEPTTLFRIVRASGARRFGARAFTPLVGREEELNLLQRRWERAARGEGQFVQIVGEPGIGKSRLVAEFRLQLGVTPHTFVEWSSSQLLQNTPLHPIAEWGRQRFGGAETPARQRLGDLENTLRLIGLDPVEYAPLLAPLVDIPLPEERAPKLAPEELRRRQLAAIVSWVLAGARTQAVALAFEDLQWADPTSIDLVRALAERGAQAPLLLLATSRPEFRPPWSLRPHHGVVSLGPLDRAQTLQMVGGLASRHALSKAVIDGVNERAGGVPLFIEEVTRLLLERGEQGGAQAIPLTLRQSLAARLDGLGDAREAAQIGAVLGREFGYPLLEAVAAVDSPSTGGRPPGHPLDHGAAALSEGGYNEPSLQASLERLAEADILFVVGAGHEANYRFKHALIQDAAYESLLKSRRQALHRRAAEVLRDQPERAAAEPEVIAHHFTEAGLDDHAIEWWGKAGDQALRRSAFQEAISHLGKAIAMADKADAGNAVGVAGQRRQLHIAYGNALIAARGYGAPETTEAFARARDSASSDKDAPERLAARYGLWAGSLLRGELPAMRAHAATFLSDVEAIPNSPATCVAHRIVGSTHWFAGEYREAQEHLERTLALFKPGRDDDLAFRFGHDSGIAAMNFLAFTLWPLGDIERAVSLVGDAAARSAAHAHVGTRAFGKWCAAAFALIRGDLSRAAQNAVELARLADAHDLSMWRAYAVFLEGIRRAESGALAGGLADMRRGVELLREQNVLLFDGLVKIALAEAEARAGDVERAVAVLDEALTMCERTAHRTFEAELHRVHGKMLLKRDPASPTTAEEALLTSIAVAQTQKARSFELLAALALAKLYQSTDRPVEAHAILAPTLEGFSPTPEMPVIAQAQALLAALSETGQVKADAARRQQRRRLQVAYGNALFHARGYGAPETAEAFDRARESEVGDKGASERLKIDYGLWAGDFARGELPSMRAHAAAFLRNVSDRPGSAEAGIAHRCAGTTHLFAGEYREARVHLEQALALFQPGRDDDLADRFGQDAGVSAMLYLAIVLWVMGDAGRAISLVRDAQARTATLTHIGARAYGMCLAAVFELECGNLSRAAPHAADLVRLAHQHDLWMWRAYGIFLDGAAKAEGATLGSGLRDMRRGAELLREQKIRTFDSVAKTALAKAEARAGDVDRAVAILDEALATTCDRTGDRACEAELHRVRGETLLKRDPANPACAEEALETAIAVAKRQAARSFELRAALSLAKLRQSTGRPAEAYAVLAPALEGFSPTPETREIAQAQTLLAALAETKGVRKAPGRGMGRSGKKPTLS